MSTDHKNLEQTLKLLFDHLQKQGLISGANKDALVKQVIDNILSVRKDGINPNELKDVRFLKTLTLTLMAQHTVNHTPGLELKQNKLFELLLTLKHDLSEKKAEEELKSVFKRLMEAINKLTPDSKKKLSDKELDKLAGYLAKRALTNFASQNNQVMMAQSNSVFNILSSLLGELSKESSADLASRQLYGGINPKQAGGIVYPVQNVVGNLLGVVDQVGGNENSTAFIDELFRYDGKADPLGIENKNLQNLGDLGVAIDSIVSVQGAAPAQGESSTYKSPTPFSDKPKPSGSGS